jgi:hypothetical protein
MPVRNLPSKPDLDHLRYQAKTLRKAHAARALDVAQRLREFHPRFTRATDAEIFASKLTLSDAQLAIAREHGFSSWPRLKKHIEKPTLADRLHLPHQERIEDPSFRQAVNLLDAGDDAGLRAYLIQHPHLLNQRVLFEGQNYFHNPSLLEFVAENPIRHGKLAPNILQVTRVLLEAGAAEPPALNETLMLVATGAVARQARMQLPLIDLLCEYGADPDSATHAAALHGEREALHHLLQRGARVDLPVAAVLGRTEDARRSLPAANSQGRHLALTLAADYGHIEIVRLLLDAGEDPNRYNPVGGHSHATPLHQAAAKGHEEVVRLLVDRGARLNIKDILWQGTPADWANHQGQTAVETYLRAQQSSGAKKN